MNHSASWERSAYLSPANSGLLVLPDRHVDVHARAVVAVVGLGHEGRGLAVGGGDVLDDVLVLQDVVGLLGEAAEDQAELVLRRGDLVVVLVDLHAHALHGRQHLGADVLGAVGRVDREVAALDPGPVAHVAHLVFGVGVPGGVDRVDLEADLVRGDRVAHVVEDEELGLGAEVGGVADAGGLQVGLGLLRGAARVARVGLVGVGLEHGAVDAQRLLGVERVDVDRARVRHQLHVGLVDRLPAGDRGAVEHEAFVEEVVVDEIGDDADVLQASARIAEPDVHVDDVLVLDHLEDGFLVCHRCFLDAG